jgi:hypothetical protein
MAPPTLGRPPAAQADAEALILDHGAEAYGEARYRERDVILPDGTTHAGRTPEHWRRVALIVARATGKRIGLNPATGLAIDADFSDRSEPDARRSKRPADDVDPLEELQRLIREKK